MAGDDLSWALGLAPLGTALCLAAGRRLISPKRFVQSLAGLSCGVLIVYMNTPTTLAPGHG